MFKIFGSTYAKSDLEQIVSNAIHLNTEERTLLLRPLESFEDLFDGTLGNWATDPVNLELNTDYKPFNSIYHPVPIINKETFQKELNLLVEIRVLTPVHQRKYGTPIFIIPQK